MGLWEQINEGLGPPLQPVPEQLGEDRLAWFRCLSGIWNKGGVFCEQ